MNNTSTEAPGAAAKAPRAPEPDAYPSPADTPDATEIPSDTATLQEEAESSEEETPGDKLIERIRAAIAYTISCHRSNQKPTVYSNFTVKVTDPPSTALTLLRTATYANIAILIAETKAKAQFSLPIPPVQREQPFNFAITSPQWWKGMTKVEMRAGPNADEAKLKQAERYVRMREENERRGARSKFLGAERHNLLIGLGLQGGGGGGDKMAEAEGSVDEVKDGVDLNRDDAGVARVGEKIEGA